jgi:AraC-like DNA-binding protein
VTLTFSTAGIPRPQRLPSLREAVTEQFLDLHVAPVTRSPQDDLEAFMNVREVGGVRIARFSGSPLTATRTPAHVDLSDHSYYMLALHCRGIARTSQRGRQITLRPGDLTLLDSSDSYTIELANAGPFEHVAYRIPRARLDARSEQVDRLLTIRVPAGSDPGRLAFPFLSTLAAPSWRTPSASTEALLETGLDLLVTALLLAAGVDTPTPSRHASLLHQLKLHARSRLGEPGLTPASVAGAHYLSTRQLHRLFARESTTFGAWVREERLRRCRRDLADPRLQGVSIMQIASNWGYRSAAHFTRAFTIRYGVGPRDFRRAAAAHSALLER